MSEEAPDYTKMQGHELYEACGTDAEKWATAFNQHAVHLGYSNMDIGWLIGWFANPMMAERDEATGQRITVLPDGSAFFIGETEG